MLQKLWLPERSPLPGWKDAAHGKMLGAGFACIPLVTRVYFCLSKQLWTGGWVLRPLVLLITQTAFKSHPVKGSWEDHHVFGEIVSAVSHMHWKRWRFACFWRVPRNRHAPQGPIQAIYAATRFSAGSCYRSALTFIVHPFSGCPCILQIRKLILKEQTSF